MWNWKFWGPSSPFHKRMRDLRNLIKPAELSPSLPLSLSFLLILSFGSFCKTHLGIEIIGGLGVLYLDSTWRCLRTSFRFRISFSSRVLERVL